MSAEATEAALVALEAVGPEVLDVTKLNTWLRLVALEGDGAQLARLARVDAEGLAPLGNAPGLVALAAERAEGAAREALEGLHGRLKGLERDRLLVLWDRLRAGRPEAVLDAVDAVEALTGRAHPEVTAHMLTDLAAQAGVPEWRQVRLYVLGWLSADHPARPDAEEALAWIETGLVSPHDGERAEAVEALAAVAEGEWLTPEQARRAVQTVREAGPFGEDAEVQKALRDALRALSAEIE